MNESGGPALPVVSSGIRIAVDVIDYCRRLPRIPGFGRIPDQLSGAATSVGSNHRAMRRASVLRATDRYTASGARRPAGKARRPRIRLLARSDDHGESGN